jgi:hypothetical protein
MRRTYCEQFLQFHRPESGRPVGRSEFPGDALAKSTTQAWRRGCIDFFGLRIPGGQIRVLGLRFITKTKLFADEFGHRYGFWECHFSLPLHEV